MENFLLPTMPTYKVNDSDTYGRNGTFNNKAYLEDDVGVRSKKYDDNLPSYSGNNLKLAQIFE